MSKRWLFRIGVLLLLVAVAAGVLAAGAQATPEEKPAVTQIEFNAVQMESDHFALYWNVAASGGGRLTSANYQLSSTIGQPVIGNFSSPSFTHRAGYWQEWVYRVFLPFILRP